ncbi:hypothetical protein S40293_11411 [Stachybotrys chartarum IBT 40293]|nr:hypothetical protein S40293_11411 [Stachybotrys chartarum IBT 40293]
MVIEKLMVNSVVMSTADPVVVSETTTGATGGDSPNRNSIVRMGRGLTQPNARRSAVKVTVWSKSYAFYTDTNWIDTGAACWDCAKNGHTCRPVPVGALAAVRIFWMLNRQLNGANADPDDAWRTAAQRAAQQLRACGSGMALPAAPPAAPGPAPPLASFGEVAEKSLEERKVMALETIAGAARLWVLNQLDEYEEAENEDNGAGAMSKPTAAVTPEIALNRIKTRSAGPQRTRCCDRILPDG